MTGFVRAMVAHAVPLPLPEGVDVVDTCGTGGDRLRSINVSTIAALVVAATGAKVCKHGGRASSSAVGAADVLEALGVVADLGPAGVARCIDEVGMGFCFAPRFHPAMRFAPRCARSWASRRSSTSWGRWPTRAGPATRWSGSAIRPWPTRCSVCWPPTGRCRAMVVYGDDGLDELSTTGPVDGARADRGRGRACTRRRPAGSTRPSLGLAPATIDELRGGERSVQRGRPSAG